ncbi:MAG TPA: helix-turn-helix domain-containing protein [Solirubrobacterales bacterium]|jgi:AcrR family transcriptional regulator|nr:helix-turn-helix domain-containing protein [Solirubrobacterales bacterium]
MAKTRTDRDREAKVGEIVELAEKRLREDGYDGLSVAALARELGLAQNAIYWYFPSKDHLFVAVLRRMLEQLAARKPRGDVSHRQRILWFTDQLAPLSRLRPALRERAQRTAVVAEFLAELEELLARMLSNALRAEGVAEEELPLAVEAFRAAVEGTYAKGIPRARRRNVLGYVLDRLTG